MRDGRCNRRARSPTAFETAAKKLEVPSGSGQFGGNGRDAAQQLLAMAEGLMLGAGFLALRVEDEAAEESGKQVRA